MSTKAHVERAVSAGGVVYRAEDDHLLVALCGRRRGRTWNLPKGTPDNGETLEETALREVREETGLQAEIQEPLGHIEYWFMKGSDSIRIHKRVYYYLMRECGGSMDDHDPEFDEVRWFPAHEAPRMLTYANETQVLERALDALAARGVVDGR